MPLWRSISPNPISRSCSQQLRRGNVVLFLGAGFSVDAKNRRNDSLPLGGALARELARVASLKYVDGTLLLVYQAARRRIGTKILNDTLPQLYSVQFHADLVQSP